VFLIQNTITELSNYFEELYSVPSNSSKPYSSELHNDLEILDLREYIHVAGSYVDPENIMYSITSRGIRFVESNVLTVLPRDVIKQIDEMKRRYLGTKSLDMASPTIDYPRTLEQLLEAMGHSGPIFDLSKETKVADEIRRYLVSRTRDIARIHAQILARDLKSCRSAYCVAMKIDSLYTVLSDMNRDIELGIDTKRLLEQILRDPSVVKVASGIPDITQLPQVIEGRVQFKLLQAVNDIINSWIEQDVKPAMSRREREAKKEISKHKKRKAIEIALIISLLTLLMIIIFLSIM